MVDFFGGGGGVMTPSLQTAYQRDPRVIMASLLAQQGQQSLQTPTPDTASAIAKALTIGLGGATQAMIGKEYADRDKAALGTLANATQAFMGGQKEFKNPDNPDQVLIPESKPGDYSALVSALAQNPDTAPMGLNSAMQLATLQAKAKIDLNNELNKNGLTLKADGSVAPIPNFGTAKAANEAPVAGAKRAAESAVDLAYKPQIAGATAAAETPALVARAGQMVPVDAQRAAAVASAETPALVSRATQTAAATAPIEVQKAIDIEAGKYAINQPNNNRNQENKLRDDFNALPPVKNYRETVTQYNGILEASKRDSKAADLNMVYGLAKIFDPGSVVREGETVMVNRTASLPDWLMGAINSLNGGARLTPETRKALLTEASGRVQAQSTVYEPLRSAYEEISKRNGVDPKNVITDVQSPLSAAPAGSTLVPDRSAVEAEMRRRGLL